MTLGSEKSLLIAVRNDLSFHKQCVVGRMALGVKRPGIKSCFIHCVITGQSFSLLGP